MRKRLLRANLSIHAYVLGVNYFSLCPEHNRSYDIRSGVGKSGEFYGIPQSFQAHSATVPKLRPPQYPYT